MSIEQINNSTEKIQYLHHDQAGSARLIAGSTGTVEGSYTYDAYGNTTGHTGTATTPLGYDGQYTSSDTGLIYVRARSYDPSTAQLLTRDPLAAISGEPYSYARRDRRLGRHDHLRRHRVGARTTGRQQHQYETLVEECHRAPSWTRFARRWRRMRKQAARSNM